MSEHVIDFLVQGSSEEPYEVTFSKEGESFTVWCTCTAGEYGQSCKHRLNIIVGRKNNIVSDNLEDVDIIQTWLPGSSLESALNKVKEAEKLAGEAKKNLSAAKIKLSQVMEYG